MNGGGQDSWLYVNASGVFTNYPLAFIHGYALVCAPGDVDGDGRLDIVIATAAESTPGSGFVAQSLLLRNTSEIPPNAPPSPPTAPRSVETQSSVGLAWDPGDDRETPREGLTYNVRLWSPETGLEQDRKSVV